MAELDEHIALMMKRRTALLDEIASLHEGDRKANLMLMLNEVDDHLKRVTSPSRVKTGKAKVPFKSGRDRAINR